MCSGLIIISRIIIIMPRRIIIIIISAATEPHAALTEIVSTCTPKNTSSSPHGAHHHPPPPHQLVLFVLYCVLFGISTLLQLQHVILISSHMWSPYEQGTCPYQHHHHHRRHYENHPRVCLTRPRTPKWSVTEKGRDRM